MKPLISCLHATRGRPEKAIACMELWAERASDPAAIEYVMAYEKSDTATEQYLDAILPELEVPWAHDGVVAIRGDFKGSAPAWNAAYRASSGMLLCQVSDDFAPPRDWDVALLNRLPSNWEGKPIVIAVNDGLRRDKMLTMLVATRAYCELAGEFLHPGYKGVFSDSEATIRAYARQKEGIAEVIEARDLLFEHQHHSKTGEPEDATYAAQNSPEAYAKGKALFMERNPGCGEGMWV